MRTEKCQERMRSWERATEDKDEPKIGRTGKVENGRVGNSGGVGLKCDMEIRNGLSKLLPAAGLSPQELANSQEILEETGNQRVVLALYEALRARDVDTVHKLLASDLEWWFHGPPSHQFMMRLLTGSEINDFQFGPESFASFGSTVLVEGCDRTRSISWVHAWTVTDGIITQVREYFNTSLTVTRLGVTDQSSSSITSLHCPSVWESSLSDRVGKSVPGLVLAI
ncbi:Wound-induced protein 1 [Camellia lanceoleosa]|uniref:Wound-induced protein 1 n=1 Tax=Camellia lanceoleosa TaxID=1840588 RepID=A0ACC0H7W1_9ERIC|nr:Wound-induced protein 1 [Camellia lanceoleosa]